MDNFVWIIENFHYLPPLIILNRIVNECPLKHSVSPFLLDYLMSKLVYVLKIEGTIIKTFQCIHNIFNINKG